MKCNKTTVLFFAGAIGMVISLISASIALCVAENKADFCYVMKKKAKKAIQQMEDKLEM